MLDDQQLAKLRKKAQLLKKRRRDARYLKVLGKLRHEGLLDVRDIPECRGMVFLEDALWAAEIEPRIFELLPAIIARRPALFAFLKLPDDLALVVKEIKTGHAKTPYRGIAPEKYDRWVAFVGKKKTRPKVMRSFRLGEQELEWLTEIAKKKSISQAQALHLALEHYVGYAGYL